jgi:transcriptional regulator with XRE-family HTH domain
MAERLVRRAAVIEGDREAQALAATLGGAVRAARIAKRSTLEGLGRRVGVSRARLSQIERGDGVGAPLHLWVALGIALGRPLAISFTKPLEEPRGPADAGHLEIQEHILALARATSRHGTFELPTRPTDPARSTDVGLRDDRHHVLIQVECW